MRDQLHNAATPQPHDAAQGPQSLPLTPLTQLEHLLKVALSVSHDANDAWADVWDELKEYVTPSGVVRKEGHGGFVPECGWPAFLEKFWMIKFYLDSISRVCSKQH